MRNRKIPLSQIQAADSSTLAEIVNLLKKDLATIPKQSAPRTRAEIARFERVLNMRRTTPSPN